MTELEQKRKALSITLSPKQTELLIDYLQAFTNEISKKAPDQGEREAKAKRPGAIQSASDCL